MRIGQLCSAIGLVHCTHEQARCSHTRDHHVDIATVSLAQMPTYEDPGCFCKVCCPVCAVYQAQGCKCPEICLAACCECCYTMVLWDPTVGKPSGAPESQEMER